MYFFVENMFVLIQNSMNRILTIFKCFSSIYIWNCDFICGLWEITAGVNSRHFKIFYLFLCRSLSICHNDGIYIIMYVASYSSANPSESAQMTMEWWNKKSLQTDFHLLQFQKFNFYYKLSNWKLKFCKCNCTPESLSFRLTSRMI